jgi:hypothetical protein
MAVYFLVFTPLSFVLRMVRPDPLRLARQPGVASHWQPVKTPGYSSMRSIR